MPKASTSFGRLRWLRMLDRTCKITHHDRKGYLEQFQAKSIAGSGNAHDNSHHAANPKWNRREGRAAQTLEEGPHRQQGLIAPGRWSVPVRAPSMPGARKMVQ
eukprot:1158943-Pelagomonas_calceolata.AAC.8